MSFKKCVGCRRDYCVSMLRSDCRSFCVTFLDFAHNCGLHVLATSLMSPAPVISSVEVFDTAVRLLCLDGIVDACINYPTMHGSGMSAADQTLSTAMRLRCPSYFIICQTEQKLSA